MSQENNTLVAQHELASEYGRYVESKRKKGPVRFIINALVIPVIAMVIVVTGAAFVVANYSPATYTQAKDVIFANVDIEKLTGLPSSAAKEQLDSWLILNSEHQQAGSIVREEPVKEETAQGNQKDNSLN